MRKMLVLMALTLVTANSVGCCCRGLRDWLCQGSCCPLFSSASTYPTATYVPAAAPVCASPCAAPTFAPTYTPAYTAAPMAAVAAPQYTMATPMAMSAPMATSCGDPCAGGCSPCSGGCSTCGGCSSGCSTCGSPCAVEASCGTPMVMGTAYQAEPSCSYPDGAAPAPTAVYPSPAAE
jgi:hypothetical protein